MVGLYQSVGVYEVFSEIQERLKSRTYKGASHNWGHQTEVAVNNLEQKSVVAASLIQTLSWKDRKAKLITQGEDGVLAQVLLRLIPLIGAGELLESIINEQLN